MVWGVLGGAVLTYIVLTVITPRLAPHNETLTVIRESSDQYKFISPLLLCINNEAAPAPEFSPLRNKLASFVAQHTGNRDADSISIYVRDLNSGRWTGVNEDEKYAPASMLKVATLLAFLKKARTSEGFLKTKLSYTDGIDESSSQFFKPKRALTRGKTYTIDELLHFMIIESDNNARRLLRQTIEQQELQHVYDDLGIYIPGSQATQGFMSAKTYSYFLRLLYNASYVGRVSSESTLAMLTQTQFKDGLVAGLPAGTIIAHKFGEREITDVGAGTTTRELHDCGIVYYGNNPYLMCVMTRGAQFQKLAAVIRDASSLVYKELTGF